MLFSAESLQNASWRTFYFFCVSTCRECVFLFAQCETALDQLRLIVCRMETDNNDKYIFFWFQLDLFCENVASPNHSSIRNDVCGLKIQSVHLIQIYIYIEKDRALPCIRVFGCRNCLKMLKINDLCVSSLNHSKSNRRKSALRLETSERVLCSLSLSFFLVVSPYSYSLKP